MDQFHKGAGSELLLAVQKNFNIWIGILSKFYDFVLPNALSSRALTKNVGLDIQMDAMIIRIINQYQLKKMSLLFLICNIKHIKYIFIFNQGHRLKLSQLYIRIINKVELFTMKGEFPQPTYSPANYNIFEIINFRTYEALPRWTIQDPDPMFMTNQYRQMANVAWHSRYRTVYPHSLSYRVLRAITMDDMEALVKVLKNPSFDINMKIDKKYNLTALQYAAMKNKFPAIELLLMFGAYINKPDEQGNSPLMMAVSNQSLEAINSLLKNGCQRDVANNYGLTPSQKAKQEEMDYIAEFIENYPKGGRRFPKFRVNLDIEKKIISPLSNFFMNYKIYSPKPLKSPFNNFKGDYKIILHDFRSIQDLLKENKNMKNQF